MVITFLFYIFSYSAGLFLLRWFNFNKFSKMKNSIRHKQFVSLTTFIVLSTWLSWHQAILMSYHDNRSHWWHLPPHCTMDMEFMLSMVMKFGIWMVGSQIKWQIFEDQWLSFLCRTSTDVIHTQVCLFHWVSSTHNQTGEEIQQICLNELLSRCREIPWFETFTHV